MTSRGPLFKTPLLFPTSHVFVHESVKVSSKKIWLVHEKTFKHAPEICRESLKKLSKFHSFFKENSMKMFLHTLGNDFQTFRCFSAFLLQFLKSFVFNAYLKNWSKRLPFLET